MDSKQELRDMCRAAAVIKEICNRRTEDDACHKCPFYAMCCAEPYSWEIPAEPAVLYFDNAATTRTSDTAIRAMLPFMAEAYGNPSSIHSNGAAARSAIEAARAVFAKRINAEPEEIIFTSGGSEANTQAIQSAAEVRGKRKIIATRIEHHSVLNTLAALERRGYEIALLEVSPDGEVSPEAVKAEITPETALVSVMLANNEIGTIQPVEEIGHICRERGVLFHVDAVQAAGHIKINAKKIKADYLSISAHKFHGPKGAGVLYRRAGAPLFSLIHGGGQEHGFRAGTENVAAIVGAAAAFDEACRGMAADARKAEAFRNRTADAIRKIPGARLFAESANRRLPGILTATFEGVTGEMLVRLMDTKGVCVSSGAACSAGESGGSHVLKAIGVPPESAADGVRISFSRYNTEAETEYMISALKEAVIQARACAPVLGTTERGDQ